MPKKKERHHKGGTQSFSGLEQFFGSRTRFGLLKVFFQNPEQKFFMRELARLADNQLNAVRREVANLENLNIIREVKDGGDTKKKFYTVNKNFVLYNEVNSLILRSDLLAEKKLVEHFSRLGSIELCVFSGILVGIEGVCDILLVGRINKDALARIIKKFENEINQTISYTVFSPEEFRQRKALTDKFLFTVFEGDKRVAIDKNGEFATESP